MSFKIIAEIKGSKVDKLFEVYEKNPVHARVMYFNAKGRTFQRNRLIFYQDGEDFSFVNFERVYGISVSNRMFTREKAIASVRYKNGKFYYTWGKIISHLTARNLNCFINNFFRQTSGNTEVMDYFTSRFSWINFILENEILHEKAFNTFVKNGLYGLNDSLRFFFKATMPTIRAVLGPKRPKIDVTDWIIEVEEDPITGEEGDDSEGMDTCISSKGNDKFKIWEEYSKVLTNVENLSYDTYHHRDFKDTCKMAKTLGKKINCSWSEKRMKQEHDAWAKEITAIVLECEDLRELNVAEIFVEFAEFSGYRLMKTNRDMIGEGMTQDNCVATYMEDVEMGKCGIFNIKGCSLELNKGDGKLAVRMNQLLSAHNRNAPKEVREQVKTMVDAFNIKKCSVVEPQAVEFTIKINWDPIYPFGKPDEDENSLDVEKNNNGNNYII